MISEADGWSPLISVQSKPFWPPQIRRALAAIERVVSSDAPFDQQTFDTVKAAVIADLGSQLQDSANWLPMMRGLSLSPPIWSAQKFSAQTAEPTATRRAVSSTAVPPVAVLSSVRDMAQTDVLGGVSALTLEQVQRFFTDHLAVSSDFQSGGSFIRDGSFNGLDARIGVVQTVIAEHQTTNAPSIEENAATLTAESAASNSKHSSYAPLCVW